MAHLPINLQARRAWLKYLLRRIDSRSCAAGRHVRQADSHSAKDVQANYRITARLLAPCATAAYVQKRLNHEPAADLYIKHLMTFLVGQLT